MEISSCHLDVMKYSYELNLHRESNSYIYLEESNFLKDKVSLFV